MYFGGLGGLTVLDGAKGEHVNISTKVTFTRLRIRNEEVYAGNKGLTTDISMAGELQLQERDNSFSLEFSSLDYESHAATIYSYRLKGFDESWTDVPSTRRFAGFTNIPPGKYTFQVRYAADGNINNSEISELNIVITPYFYKTWWFICLMVMMTCCVVIYLYMHRLYQLQRQKQLLHRKVEERTRELKEQNEKIRRQKETLVEMSKKVRELTLDKLAFFTNITHEFRTPLTLIIGPIERALRLSNNPQVIEQLSFVERNSRYLLSLINQLMDFRKIESGKLEIVKTKGNLVEFMDLLLVSFEAFAAERNINIRKFYRMSDPVILFDPDSMHKVISNLMSNAIKFTPDGGTVTLYVFNSCDREDKKGKLYIFVKDTGIGIPEEDIPKIFDRFYQARNKTYFPVYGQSGTGIGLYLCKQIAMRCGGDIMVRNNKNAGSTFIVHLPVSREDSGEVQSLMSTGPVFLPEIETIRSAPSDFEAGKHTILVVEDNRDMLAYICSILKEQYHVIGSENGSGALIFLNSHHVDFIISDLMMPVMDGLELSRKVKQNFAISHIPFLMLTAKTSQEARIESYRTGVDEYLQKPFNEELLLTRIGNMLENRKRQQQRFALNMEVDELQIDEDSNDKKFLDKAMTTIRDNYKNSYYEINGFITAMGASKSVINKKMQSLTGQSIGQFIRNYRLNIAYEMIKKNRVTRNMNISEIAYEVGFNDPKYFTRCFTKRYHVTPSSLLEEDENPNL
jgi:signal transduction histidine kinase/DNA-binding NarL/FixJ family response regulator